MEITQRELITAIHGMLFGGFFLMAIFGGIVLLLEDCREAQMAAQPVSHWRTIYVCATAALGWAAVLSGDYIIYPWYRAAAPAGADLAMYPKYLLTAHASTAGWHNFGMEWKEHVARIAPMAMTAVGYVMLRHRASWNADRAVRIAVLGFATTAFLAAAIAGAWGAMINKAAPVRGGNTIQLMRSAP